MNPQIVILDFGSQYTQLIARSVRELGVYCTIVPGNAKADKVLADKPKALIFSGGPASVNEEGAPQLDKAVLEAGLPIFAICYGMQIVTTAFGGEVGGWGSDDGGDGVREFGPAKAQIKQVDGPFSSFSSDEELDVWMSHGDKVTKIPHGFECIASSNGSPVAAFGNKEIKVYGVQFHPEVHHTPRGKEILDSFLFETAGLEKDWDPQCFISETVEGIANKVPEGNVVCGLSGGVDSTVAAVLVHKAIGQRLHCIFVDNGLLRADESDEVMQTMQRLDLNITRVDAGDRFLSELEGVTDPEKKRKIIGRVFIEVFEDAAHKIQDVSHLVQGTLYPDVIESVSVIGKSATIKSHHNVGGLIDNMKLGLIEPLRELFKDEVREIGLELGIPRDLIFRQPFPGPGLAVRCLGDLTEVRLEKLRQADKIVREEIQNAGLNEVIWQSFAVLLPVHSVGVMGDARTYDETIAIRAITSRDGMTADWFYFDEDLLRRMSNRIVNETAGVNRVVLDISTKPPATIEWE